jgi:hypothetical protein
MILITTYYRLKNKERNEEIDKCLFYNYQNDYIEKIYLLNNEIYNIPFIKDKKKKIIQYLISEDKDYKLKFNDAIKFINEKLNDRICILSNSDIYFDKSLSKINNKTIYNNCFSLLRYDEDNKGNKIIFSRYGESRDDSQDSWIFRSPLNIDLNKLNFSFGTLGSDSIFCTLIKESNINLSNPCFDIISTHVHKSDVRTYKIDDRIHGTYTLVKPCHLGEISEIKQINY